MKENKFKFYIYILECGDGSYYIGFTQNLFSRIKYHCKGEGASYTRKRMPVKLILYLEFSNRYDALYIEKKLKGWSRNKKKAFVSGDFEMLKALSKNLHHKNNCLKIYIPDQITNYM